VAWRGWIEARTFCRLHRQILVPFPLETTCGLKRVWLRHISRNRVAQMIRPKPPRVHLGPAKRLKHETMLAPSISSFCSSESVNGRRRSEWVHSLIHSFWRNGAHKQTAPQTPPPPSIISSSHLVWSANGFAYEWIDVNTCGHLIEEIRLYFCVFIALKTFTCLAAQQNLFRVELRQFWACDCTIPQK